MNHEITLTGWQSPQKHNIHQLLDHEKSAELLHCQLSVGQLSVDRKLLRERCAAAYNRSPKNSLRLYAISRRARDTDKNGKGDRTTCDRLTIATWCKAFREKVALSKELRVFHKEFTAFIEARSHYHQWHSQLFASWKSCIASKEMNRDRSSTSLNNSNFGKHGN